ncbi:MAG: hypothetical protein VYE77_00560 [Planctomycetota bacterium]|nr:hypothetical protein [Planctomycetota bacterium]
MKYTPLLSLLLLTAGGCGNHVQLEPNVEQQLKERTETYLRGFHSGDGDVVASMTNPRFLVRVGGAGKVRDAIREGSRKLRSNGWLVESVTFVDPIEAMGSSVDDRRIFAIVPFSLVTKQKGGGGKVRDDFMVAIKETEPGTWTMIEGQKARMGAMHDLYPDDFGSDYAWPEMQMRDL